VNGDWLPSPRDRWVRTGASVTAGIAIVAIVVGFGWLPYKQPGVQFRSLWDAICSAAGLIQAALASQPIVQTSYPVTQVEIPPGMLRDAGSESIGRGATLALRCTLCHGERGMSQADSPDLAGQYPIAISALTMPICHAWIRIAPPRALRRKQIQVRGQWRSAVRVGSPAYRTPMRMSASWRQTKPFGMWPSALPASAQRGGGVRRCA
jgi:hypothetical protein